MEKSVKIMTTKYTWYFILFISVLIGGMDVYLYNDSIDRNSISQVIIDAANISHLIPYAIGFLSGALAFHFFDNYTQKRRANDKVWK